MALKATPNGRCGACLARVLDYRRLPPQPSLWRVGRKAAGLAREAGTCRKPAPAVHAAGFVSGYR